MPRCLGHGFYRRRRRNNEKSGGDFDANAESRNATRLSFEGLEADLCVNDGVTELDRLKDLETKAPLHRCL